MTRLMPFQEATVRAACGILSSTDGPRRFLVADEVGLGKTVVAREIIRRLAQRSGGQKTGLTVFYFANSLGLTTQNGDSLAKLSAAGMTIARFKRDRLGLAATWQPGPADVRLFVLSPLTSLPGSRSHGGTRKERALALAMAAATFPGVLRGEVRDEVLGTSGLRHLIAEQLRELRRTFGSLAIRRGMTRAFASALCGRLGTRHSSGDFRECVKAWRALRNSDPREHKHRKRILIDGLREALCCAALARHEVRPDLVVLDEFQKYAWLMKQGAGIAPRIIDAGSGTGVLLLSATPFEEHRNQSEPPVVGLARFLHGPARGEARANELRLALQDHAALLRGFDPAASPERTASWRERVAEAKQRVEAVLRPVMERTERKDDPALDLGRSGSGCTMDSLAELAVDDLRVFDDFAGRLRGLRGKRERAMRAIALSQATPLWLSVPYPVATLPSTYVAGRALERSVGGGVRGVPSLQPPRPDLPPRAQHQAVQHPKLRRLIGTTSPDPGAVCTSLGLRLPWLPPSLPWWPLEGAWADAADASKALVFAQFRASPAAIAALVSRETERRHGPQKSAWSNVVRVPRQGFREAKGRSGNSVLSALFHPWRELIIAFDPATASRTRAGMLAVARRAAARLLTHERGFCSSKRGASLPEVLRQLDQLPKPGGALTPVSKGTIEEVAKLMAAGPGVVLGRTLRRFDREALEGDAAKPDTPYGRLCEVVHRQLRTYLAHQHFEETLAGPRRRQVRRQHGRSARRGTLLPAHEALLDAILDGNLESTLDETIFTWLRVGVVDPSRRGRSALDQLARVFRVHAGSLQLRGNRRGKRAESRQQRAHVALALTGHDADAADAGEGPPRPDTLRVAFNGPFWPHVLTTTAVGQEGLDLHLWCQTVIHWDPPPDPLALEQREGRIDRHAGLSVRRAIAADLGAAALMACKPHRSPWLELSARVDRDYGSRPSTWWKKLMGLRWPRFRRPWVEVAGFRWWAAG